MNVLKPHLQTTIRTLLEAGATQREIERVTGIWRHTVRAWHKRFAEEVGANCSRVATGSGEQTAPPRPPAPTSTTTSPCEPHRAFIEAQLRLKRNATAVYQDLVDLFGFAGHYNSVKRFVARLKVREPAQFDRLEFAPGEEMQVDYGEGALTRVPSTDRYRRPRLFVATLRYSRRSFRRVVWKSSQQVWAELHEQAWRYFGGTTHYVMLDSFCPASTIVRRDMAAQGSAGGVLELAAVPTFATRWLLPRLGDFAARCPGVRVHLSSRTVPFLFDGTPFDAAIHAGIDAWPGTTGPVLMRETLIAVGSPRLSTAGPAPDGIDWSRLPLLQQSTRPYAWREWFASRGMHIEGDLSGPRFELFSMTMEAARSALGAARVPHVLVAEELARGTLVQLSSHRYASPMSYRLLYPEHRALNPALERFRDWLLEQAGEGSADPARS